MYHGSQQLHPVNVGTVLPASPWASALVANNYAASQQALLLQTLMLCPGPLLKEAVDDLEWPGGPVSLRLARDPAAVSLAASGTGSLEVRGLTCSLLQLSPRTAVVLSRQDVLWWLPS